ncbi:MAG TPA: VOC family protein [Vicinamibacterales bacterium]
MLTLPTRGIAVMQAVLSRVGVRAVGVQLVVENVERSARFYAGVLGMDVVQRSPGLAVLPAAPGGCAIALREIAGDTPRTAHRRGVTLRFQVDSVETLDGVSARLVQAGTRVSPLQQGSRRSIFAADPDGHAFEAYHDESDLQP